MCFLLVVRGTAKMKQDGHNPFGTSRADAKLGCTDQPSQDIAESVHSLPLPSAGPSDSDGLSQEQSSDAAQTFHLDMWFVRMRWIACAVSGTLIILSVWVLHYMKEEVFWPLAIVVVGLLASNVLFHQCVRRQWFKHCLNEIQIYSDLVFLTALLHFSGGIENPAMLTYVFHVIISGILLNKRKCYTTVVIASILFGAMAFAEMSQVLEHYTLGVFSQAEAQAGQLHPEHQSLYTYGVVAFQAVLMSLAAYFTTTIMDRLRAEEARALARHQSLQRVLQATGAGFVILDKQLHPVWLNNQAQKWLRLFGKSSKSGPNSAEQYVVAEHAPAAETLHDGKIRVTEQQVVDAHGAKRFFQITLAPLTDKSGSIYQVVQLSQEITERKLIEAEMMHSAKMTALGIMAAGIAHEVGNPLASISARLRLLEEDHEEGFLMESLRLLQDQTRRIARIVHGVSQVARPAKDEWTQFSANDVVGETLKILGFHELAKRCQIRSSLADDLPQTMGVKDEIAQVFLNLGLNALEAMPNGGTLTVKTYRSGNVILIEFADTGKGIDSEIRARIFDPFFSTKDTGQGLGLSIVHNIIYGHGGRIELLSNTRGGSVFKVTLPIGVSGKPISGHRRTEQL